VASCKVKEVNGRRASFWIFAVLVKDDVESLFWNLALRLERQVKAGKPGIINFYRKSTFWPEKSTQKILKVLATSNPSMKKSTLACFIFFKYVVFNGPFTRLFFKYVVFNGPVTWLFFSMLFFVPLVLSTFEYFFDYFCCIFRWPPNSDKQKMYPILWTTNCRLCV